MIAILIINYRTASATAACVEAALAQGEGLRVFLLDNGSGAADAHALAELARTHPGYVEFESSAGNIGFAAGMNRLLERALAQPDIDHVLLLNSDALMARGALAALRAAIDLGARVDMVAANLRTPGGDHVDSLGISLYRLSLIHI